MAVEQPSGSPLRDAGLLLIGLAIIFLFWLVNGGKAALKTAPSTVQSPIAQFGASSTRAWLPFLSGTTDSSSSGSYTASNGVTVSGYSASPDAGKVYIGDYYAAKMSDPEQEYVTLYANSTNAGSIDISGWKLVSVRSQRSITIGGAVSPLMLGAAQSPTVVSLAPSGSATISSGRSPIGVSFRENMCTGYLSQFQKFTPALAQSCPYPQTELSSHPELNNDSTCSTAVMGISPCRTPLQNPSASYTCSQFITSHFSYNGCVTSHQSDSNFASKTWRVYGGQTTDMWDNSSDTLALLDGSGKLVHAISY